MIFIAPRLLFAPFSTPRKIINCTPETENYRSMDRLFFQKYISMLMHLSIAVDEPSRSPSRYSGDGTKVPLSL